MELAPEIHRWALAIVFTLSVEIESWLNPLREEEAEARKLATQKEKVTKESRRRRIKKKKKLGAQEMEEEEEGEEEEEQERKKTWLFSYTTRRIKVSQFG